MASQVADSPFESTRVGVAVYRCYAYTRQLQREYREAQERFQEAQRCYQEAVAACQKHNGGLVEGMQNLQHAVEMEGAKPA